MLAEAAKNDVLALSNDLHSAFERGQKLRFRPGAYGVLDSAQVTKAAQAAWGYFARWNHHRLNNPHWVRSCQLGRKAAKEA